MAVLQRGTTTNILSANAGGAYRSYGDRRTAHACYQLGCGFPEEHTCVVKF